MAFAVTYARLGKGGAAFDLADKFKISQKGKEAKIVVIGKVQQLDG